MRPDKRGSAASTTTLVVFALPVIWLGLIGGSCAAPGRTLIDWINAFGTAIEQPWHFSFNQYSLKAILIALAAYALCIHALPGQSAQVAARAKNTALPNGATPSR